jgi:hypothetical protein
MSRSFSINGTLTMRMLVACLAISLCACESGKPPVASSDTSNAKADVTVDTVHAIAETTSAPAAIEKFEIVSPKGGDTLVEGHTYVIRWTAGTVRHINLGSAIGGHDKGLMLNNAPAHPDSLTWKVPVGFVTGFGQPSSDQIRLRLENADSAGQWVETKPFVVTGAARR